MAEHDPGGKVRTRMKDGMRGTAYFGGPGNCYRFMLTREWGGSDMEPFVMFIGMNPSTATGEENDPTITREIGFTKRLGFTSYCKTNVSPYRWTDGKTLEKQQVNLSPEENYTVIHDWATQASKVILATGNLGPRMMGIAKGLVKGLYRSGVSPLWCFGTTKNGSPRHTLYLPGDADLEIFMTWPDTGEREHPSVSNAT